MTTSVVLPPLPEKFQSLRAHQVDAIEAILDAFTRVDFVFLDAPTGSGKTLIGEMVRRRLMERGDVASAIYLCSDKSLQQQFVKDFPYAKLIMGRANYPTELHARQFPIVSAEDCTARGKRKDGAPSCDHCTSKRNCPYQMAKAAAVEAPLAVANTAYYLTEANAGGRGVFSGRDLVIIDECDVLESSLLSLTEFHVSAKQLETLHMTPPVRGARVKTRIAWLEQLASTIGDMLDAEPDMEPKKAERWARLKDEATGAAFELTKEADPESEGDGRWVRIYDDREKDELRSFTMKPVLVNGYGPRRLWKHGGKHLLMSASIISADEQAETLGVYEDWEIVTVPMTFPVERRPIIMAPVIENTYANRDTAPALIADGIVKVLNRPQHQGQRVLVHCVSYYMARDLMTRVMAAETGRGLYTYSEGKDKARMLAAFLRDEGAVMFAPSMDRGVDLPDDACRVVIVAKMPYLALGDRQVSERRNLRDPDGQLWYTVQNVRKFVQMIGRGMRHENDQCTTYVLDREFVKLWRRDRSLLPTWVQEAVDTADDLRWLNPR